MLHRHVGWACGPASERCSRGGPVPLWLTPSPRCLCSLQGGVKVLITGPWQEASNNYSCLFDQISVPASLIQPGVLRCYCPGEREGRLSAEAMGPRRAGLWVSRGRRVAWGTLWRFSGPQFPAL